MRFQPMNVVENILAAVFVLFALYVFLVGVFFLPNFVLIGLSLLVSWTLKTRKIPDSLRVIVAVTSIMLMSIYFLHPKAITACGVLPVTVVPGCTSVDCVQPSKTKSACMTIYCQGIPFYGMPSPYCIGTSYNEDGEARPAYLDYNFFGGRKGPLPWQNE